MASDGVATHSLRRGSERAVPGVWIAGFDGYSFALKTLLHKDKEAEIGVSRQMAELRVTPAGMAVLQ